MEKRYKLGHKKAIKIHNDIINRPNAYSLTLTLKPYYNALPIHEQYNKYTANLSAMMKRMNRTYNIVMATPELTKEFNIHYHLYLQLPIDQDHILFEQSLKSCITKTGVIGRNYRLKKIDEVTDILKGYPFKDIERTLYVRDRLPRISNNTTNEKNSNCLFNPFHSVFTGKNSWKII